MLALNHNQLINLLINKSQIIYGLLLKWSTFFFLVFISQMITGPTEMECETYGQYYVVPRFMFHDTTDGVHADERVFESFTCRLISLNKSGINHNI